MYTQLRFEEIIRTSERLCNRIDRRFPDSSLAGVSREVSRMAETAFADSSALARPMWGLRALLFLMVVALLAGAAVAVRNMRVRVGEFNLPEFVQMSDAGMNVVVLIGAGIIFVVTMENRVKRRKVIGVMQQLRALAHIVDMHQLTKDPDRLLSRSDTGASPRVNLTPFELTRYLDYCSEMLALIGKLAAAYVQKFPDTDAVNAASEVEVLTTNLSRKIWQKIMIVESLAVAEAGGSEFNTKSPRHQEA